MHHNKPSTADSDNDDLARNFFYFKLRSFFHSITPTHAVHLLLACCFALLGIIYSLMAMQGEGTGVCALTNLSPVPLLLLKPHPIISHSNTRVSYPLVVLVLFFFFIVSGMENSCIYLTHALGIQLNLSESQSLTLQLCYFAGRAIDLSITYLWFFLDRYKRKPSNSLSIKCHILFRLVVLLAISILDVFHPTVYFLFGALGLLLSSLSSLLLYWIERDLCVNVLFLRLISLFLITGEMLFPVLLFHRIEHLTRLYLWIGLAVLTSLFLLALQISRHWHRQRMYRLLSTSPDVHDMESQDNAENERVKETKLQ